MPSSDEDGSIDAAVRELAHAPDVPLDDALIGRKIGRFRVEKKLGAGGMGVVYVARDEQLDRRVALKTLPVADDETARQRLLREARTASRVVHPNVATVFEAGEADDVVYIAMELVEGVTLREWSQRNPSVDERLEVLRAVAAGLAKAHELGIVHRDLKPDNVMVGPGGVVKVLDFGLAKMIVARPTGDTASVTIEGRLLGTPCYMSPEQTKGKSIDARSDVFAFGTLAYELFTNKRAFQADSLQELLIAIARDEPTPMRVLTPRVPTWLVAVVERCLRKQQEERFADGGELVQALARPASGWRSLVASGVSTARGSRPSTVRLRLGAVGVVLVVSAVMAVAIGFRRRSTSVSNGTTSSSASASASGKPLAITDAPLPNTSNPEALAAYRTALQDVRDGSMTLANVNFQRAFTLDPAFVEARLRWTIYILHDFQWLEPFEKIAASRTRLGERDLALFNLFEPFVVASPRTRGAFLLDFPSIPSWSFTRE